MKLKKFDCPGCGAALVKEGEFYKCSHCNALYYDEDAPRVIGDFSGFDRVFASTCHIPTSTTMDFRHPPSWRFKL